MSEKINFRCCDPRDHDGIPVATESKTNGKDWINWGKDNQYPQTLFEAYGECSTLGSVINAVTEYTAGSGLTNDKVINRKGDMLSDLVQQIVLDYITTGNATVQVIRNKNNEIVELNYVDVRYCRQDEDGENIYYSKKWTAYARDIKKYPAYKHNGTEPSSIYWMKAPRTKTIYAQPMWGSALREVLTMIEASKVNYNTVLNNFAPNTMIAFANGVPSDDVQDQIEQKIIDKFTGANGTNIMISWSDDREHTPEITAFEAGDFTAKYNTIIDSCSQRILAAFRCSAQLIGISTQETGFSDIEYTNSFSLFKATVIKPLQKQIEAFFKKLDINFELNEFIVTFANGGDQTIM